MIRMQQSTSAGGAKAYFTNSLSKGDYYTQGQELTGKWGGSLAEQMGLTGDVKQADFNALCDNRQPNGERLTGRDTANRTVHYDINFHAPKSVSVLYEHNQDERILSAFRESVQETMSDIEGGINARVRIDGKNEERRTANIAYAEFVHFTARPVGGIPDPHLHVHNVVFNATYDAAEEKIKAGQFREIKKDMPYYQAGFHNRFASKLQTLGYAVERTAKGWEISGIERDTIEKFSRRTDQIEKLAKERGITDADIKGSLGAKTRATKENGLDRAALRTLWNERKTEDENTRLNTITERAKNNNVVQLHLDHKHAAKAAIEFAIQHEFQNASVVRDRTIMTTALKNNLGLSPQAVQAAFDAREDLLKDKKAGVSTTKEVLQEEKAIIKFEREGRGKHKPLADSSRPLARDFLNKQQQNAVRHVWQSTSTVTAIRGGAGTGKTTLLQEVGEGLAENEKRLMMFAPSNDAADVLNKEGFKANTLQMLLVNPKLQESVNGAVIGIDEAGLVSAPNMRRLFEITKEQKARVLLVGDAKQHKSVERGDSFRLLQSFGMPVAEVKEIQRQKGEYKKTVADVEQGNLSKAFERLEKAQAIHEIEDTSARHQAIAERYTEILGARESVLIVSPSNKEAESVTGAVREHLRAEGSLQGEKQKISRLKTVHLTEPQKQDPRNYEAGMVIEFHQNHKNNIVRGQRLVVSGIAEKEVLLHDALGQQKNLPLDASKKYSVYEQQKLDVYQGETLRITKGGKSLPDEHGKKHEIRNGSVYKVAGFTEEGNVQLNNGWIVDKDFAHLNHGYVSTSHSSQGKTVQRVIVAQSEESSRAASLEQFYVTVSRGKKGVEIFTDSKEDLKDAVAGGSPRQAAYEMLDQKAKHYRLEKEARRAKDEEQIRMKQNEMKLRNKAPTKTKQAVLTK